jgi:hypothetical protein
VAADTDRRTGARRWWRVIWQTGAILVLIIAVVAIVQELRKKPEDRTWHGTVADFVPYDFRKPTVEKFRATYWNPEGPMLQSKVFGVGWAPNFGAVKKLIEAKTQKS